MEGYYLIGPIDSFEIDGDGNHLSHKKWAADRVSDCRINGVLVSPMAFRKFLHERKRRPFKMDRWRLRWNLIRHIR